MVNTEFNTEEKTSCQITHTANADQRASKTLWCVTQTKEKSSFKTHKIIKVKGVETWIDQVFLELSSIMSIRSFEATSKVHGKSHSFKFANRCARSKGEPRKYFKTFARRLPFDPI